MPDPDAPDLPPIDNSPPDEPRPEGPKPPKPTPMRAPVLPGRPLGSGLTPLAPAEQEEFHRQHRAMIRRLTPFFEDVRACQRRAWVTAHTYVVG